MTKMLFSLALGALALVATACGGAGAGSAAGSTAASTATTVSVKHVDGVGNVLVDSQGMALYSPQQETGGKVMCTGSCISIWVPLTLSASAKPTGSSDVATKLGTVDRPDGAVQVTYQGKPLYTFAEDTSPGKVTGNGFHDQFGGRQFTWEVASVGAVSSTSTSTGRGYYEEAALRCQVVTGAAWTGYEPFGQSNHAQKGSRRRSTRHRRRGRLVMSDP